MFNLEKKKRRRQNISLFLSSSCPNIESNVKLELENTKLSGNKIDDRSILSKFYRSFVRRSSVRNGQNNVKCITGTATLSGMLANCHYRLIDDLYPSILLSIYVFQQN